MQVQLILADGNNSNSKLLIEGELDQNTITYDYWAKMTSDKQKVIESSSKELELDLSKVERADTAGLAWLINLIKDSKKHHIVVNITNVPPKLINLADLSGAKELIES